MKRFCKSTKKNKFESKKVCKVYKVATQVGAVMFGLERSPFKGFGGGYVGGSHFINFITL